MSGNGRWVAVFLVVFACGRTAIFDEEDPGVDEGLDSGTAIDGGLPLDAGTDAGSRDAGGDGGSADAGVPPFDTGPLTRCPHVIWSGAMPIRYLGDTSGLPNWVSSLSRAWRDDPDDSFEFTIPASGRYRITVDAGISDLGLTFRNIDGTLHSTQGCPDGGYLMLDRAVIGRSGDAFFDAGTRVLVWISVPDWLPQTPTGTYELRVNRQ